jgi:hypothetical protein
MSNPSYRKERVERLLEELQYEISRGVLEREIDEEIGFRFIVPKSSKVLDGVVFCEFRTRPMHRYEVPGLGMRWQVVAGGKG